MAHCYVVVEAAPDAHKHLLDEINKRKYNFTGHRKGYNIPEVSEIKLYDFRLKKEVVPFFLRDLNAGVFFPEQKVKLKHIFKKYKDFFLVE